MVGDKLLDECDFNRGGRWPINKLITEEGGVQIVIWPTTQQLTSIFFPTVAWKFEFPYTYFVCVPNRINWICWLKLTFALEACYSQTNNILGLDLGGQYWRRYFGTKDASIHKHTLCRYCCVSVFHGWKELLKSWSRYMCSIYTNKGETKWGQTDSQQKTICVRGVNLELHVLWTEWGYIDWLNCISEQNLRCTR